jgi:hypothetical protein
MKRTPHPWHVFGGGIGAAVLAMIVAAAVAACGSSGGGAGAGPGSSSPSASTPYGKALALTQCIRAHGDPNWPDPNADGSFPSGHGDPPQAAVQACRNLMVGLKPTNSQLQENFDKLLNVSRCVRAHGYSTFPDPSAPGSQGQNSTSRGTQGTGIDPHSPQFQAAYTSCYKQYFGTSPRGHRGSNP